jgi:hypothetical protein
MTKVFNYFLIVLSLVTGDIHLNIAAAQEPALSVGVLAPLSGPLAEMGASFKHGFELYRSDHPESRVQFHFLDHRYEGRETATALHSLRNMHKARISVVWGNTPSSVAAPIAEQQKFPLLAVSSNSDSAGRRFVTTMGPPLTAIAEKLVAHLREVQAVRPGVLMVDLGNATQVAADVERRLGGVTLNKVVGAQEVDFTPAISQLKSRGVDGLVLFLLPDQALTFFKQAKQLQYLPHIIGGDVFAVESFQKRVAPLSQHTSYVYSTVDHVFIERLSTEPAGTSYFGEVAMGYTIAALCDALARRTGATDQPENILDKLSSLPLTGLPIPGLSYQQDSGENRRLITGVSVYATGARKL